jgi:DNA repair exonuclease SbcCD ATPase subunit
VLRRDVGDLKALRKRAEEAQQTLSQWEKLQGQLTLAKQTCDQLRSELPKSDPVSLRSEHTSLQADETSLNNSLKGLRVNLVENESEIERLNKDLTRIQQQIADVANALNREEDKRKHQQDSIERARRVLPEAWRAQCDAAGLGEQHQWKVEQDELLAKQTESRYQGLATARAGVENLRQEILTAETEANAFPAESRGTPEEVQALLREAKARVKQCDLALEQASKQKGILDHHRELRKEIDGKLLSLDREHNYYVLLAQLLGRDRLQRHLVREAERQIIDYSNAVLDRLSAGQLFLRLCGSEEGTDTTRALELEAYNRATGESPINVAFLSGSQRFRVAVSLALGIGQYASRQHRPIESVIIDEGFGCLDRNGRQVMIQEMQNLRGQLRCILLVSHQEEFADAFPDGYRFELSNGATRISRIQR